MRTRPRMPTAWSNLIQELSTQVKADPGDASLRYHLAHAQYRRGLLEGVKNAHQAESAFADCVDQLKPVLSQDVKSAEALVLQSACYADLASYQDPRISPAAIEGGRAAQGGARTGSAQSSRRVFLQHGGSASGEARLRLNGSARSPSCNWPCNCSTRPRPPASTLPDGGMPRRTWRWAGSCSRAVIFGRP